MKKKFCAVLMIQRAFTLYLFNLFFSSGVSMSEKLGMGVMGTSGAWFFFLLQATE